MKNFEITKKTIIKISILLFISTIINISIGDFINEQQSSWSKTIIVGIPTLNESREKLNHINTKFCNNWFKDEKLVHNIDIKIRPGEEKEICIIHYNTSSKDIYLWWWFPDNTKEPNWGFNCSSNYSRNNPFSKFIKPFEEKIIKVPANWYVIRKTTIKFPVWVNWIQKWCFAYWEDPWNLTWWQMFLFVLRKIHYINFSIEWKNYTKIEKTIDTFFKNKNILIYTLLIVVFLLLILEIKKQIKIKK